MRAKLARISYIVWHDRSPDPISKSHETREMCIRTSAEWLGSVWTHGVISLPSIDALQNVHSITSSAVARSGNAVLRLITSWNLVRTGDVGQLIAL
jgi:hypothetical protein